MRINPRDPKTLEYIPMVLNPLAAALGEALQLATLSRATRTSITMLARMVNQMLEKKA